MVKLWSRLIALPSLLSIGAAQLLSPGSLVPAGTVVSGNYEGPLRPQIHFSAPQGFINDPNGMFLDADGLYHLYYQYNPTATIAGNQHWGHATSHDLIAWTNQAIAIAPDNSSQGIFSGSAVIDVNNTSGFFPNQTNGVVAFYTLNGPYEQTQDMAYSHDGGYSFTKYAGNPLISIGSNQFRDPKVIWYEDHWVMIVSFVTEYKIGFYTSTDMKSWTLASNFSQHGLLGLQWECPNLVELPFQDNGSFTNTMWLLYVSVQPGAPQGGSIGQSFFGHFNGTHFTAVDSVFRMADFGKDNYAAQFFYNIPPTQPQVSIAWASNWQYTNNVPTGPLEGWQSAMSLPRYNFVRNATRAGYTLVSLPYSLNGYQSESPVTSNSNLGNGTLLADLRNNTSGAFVLNVTVTGLNTSALSYASSINYTISSSVSGESIRGGIGLGSDISIWLTRGNIRGPGDFVDNPYATNKISTSQVLPPENSYDFQVFIDRSIVELFSLDGEQSATMVYYPSYMLDTVVVDTAGINNGATVNAAVYSLQSGWAKTANSTGYVQTNSSMSTNARGVMSGW